MSGEKSSSNQKMAVGWNEEFAFKFKTHAKKAILRVQIAIPPNSSTKELMHRLVEGHDLPAYVENELFARLNIFIVKKTKEYHDSLILSACAAAKERQGDASDLAQLWNEAYCQEHATYSPDNPYDEDMAFSDVYHSLIHSPALEMLLKLEHGYSTAVSELMQKREDALMVIQDRQSHEMEALISGVGATCSDKDVNTLAAKQLEESQIQEIYWSSALSELQETQKREYREWVYNVHENAGSCNAGQNVTAEPSFESLDSSLAVEINTSALLHNDSFGMEESFTIHLGHQMKTMHNVRLLSGNVLALCSHRSTLVGGTLVHQPQQLQTAMALYSQSLSALLVLVDNRLQSQLDIKQEFRKICHRSTEFHFPDLDKQTCLIEQMLKSRTNRSRTVRGMSQINHRTVQRLAEPHRTTNILQTGDFYVTKHSNLATVQVVFHLVADDSVTDTNINSRHPIMVGLRNIMLASARHNVDTITIPLLLVHEMTENLTVQWCLKRAELIFKCVKGFMMEGLSWGGVKSKTVQFIVPEGISEELFTAFSSMLPTVFRVSTTLDLSDLSRK